jgi:hypothetical protein
MAQQHRLSRLTPLLTVTGFTAAVVAFAGLVAASTDVTASGILVVIVCGFCIAAWPVPGAPVVPVAQDAPTGPGSPTAPTAPNPPTPPIAGPPPGLPGPAGLPGPPGEPPSRVDGERARIGVPSGRPGRPGAPR